MWKSSAWMSKNNQNKKKLKIVFFLVLSPIWTEMAKEKMKNPLKLSFVHTFLHSQEKKSETANPIIILIFFYV